MCGRQACQGLLSNCCSPFRIFAAAFRRSFRYHETRFEMRDLQPIASASDILNEWKRAAARFRGWIYSDIVRCPDPNIHSRNPESGIKSPPAFRHAYCSSRASASAREHLREDSRYYGNHEKSKRGVKNICDLSVREKIVGGSVIRVFSVVLQCEERAAVNFGRQGGVSKVLLYLVDLSSSREVEIRDRSPIGRDCKSK